MRKFLWLLAVLAGYQVSASAQVFVKTANQKAVALRVQTLRADVEIVGAFAITHWEMGVQMEGVGFGTYNEGVCDFIVARPVDAKVTDFAVEQWQRKLVGRVVERSLAAPRVAFRAAPDDPLLRSGLNARNSFRATIYPISSWNGVTLRGTWVQLLPSVKGRTTYRLPLLSLRGATTRLPELSAKIRVRDAALTALSNNYGLPAKTESGARVVSLGQKNYRVTRDLVVSIARQPSASAALLFAPNAAKTGGHFALSMVAARDAKTLAISGSGITEQNLSAPKSARVGDLLVFSGTYQGEPSQIAPQLVINGVAAPFVFVAQDTPVADALWATQRIDALGAAPAQRAQVIALSKTYSVASRYTTWLTVDNENLKIYARALVSSQLDPLVREYWLRVGDGREKSARTVQLRRAITLISRANRLNERDELYARLGSAIDYAAYDGGYIYDGKPRTRKERRYVRLSAQGQRFVNALGKGSNLYELRTQLSAEYRKPHPDYKRIDELQGRFSKIYGITDFDPRLAFLRTQINAREFEAQTKIAEKAGNTVALARLQEERNRNTNNFYFTNNIGDPPIYVAAPAEARGVVAIMPDGSVKVLDYNALQKRWEGNYDIPATMSNGDYAIQIVIALESGARRRYAMHFRVDTAPPTGTGRVLLSSGEPASAASAPSEAGAMRLEIEHGGDVARVTALLPWGEKVALLPSTRDGNRFFLTARVPREWRGKAVVVKYVLVDRAHNLTSIEAESVSASSPAPAP